MRTEAFILLVLLNHYLVSHNVKSFTILTTPINNGEINSYKIKHIIQKNKKHPKPVSASKYMYISCIFHINFNAQIKEEASHSVA